MASGKRRAKLVLYGSDLLGGGVTSRSVIWT